MNLILVLYFPFLSFAFNISLIVTSSGPEGEILEGVFQEALISKGFDVLIRRDLSFVLDEREKISLKAFKGRFLKDLKASDCLVILKFFLSEKGTYNVILEAVSVQDGEIILTKNYVIPSLSLNYLNEIANNFSDKLLEFLDYSQASRKIFEIQLLNNQEGGPRILRIRCIKNGWIKFFRSEKGFLELLYEFKVSANEVYDFLIGNLEKGIEFKIMWLPVYLPLANLEISELESQIKKRGIEDWFIKELRF